jgi:DNA ligase-1
MKAFVELFENIDQTKSTKEKTQYIQEYFRNASPNDAAWALYLLSGHKLKRLIGSPKLMEWCQESLSIPSWLMSESYSSVGDVAETVSLLMAPECANETSSTLSLSEWIENKIIPLYDYDQEQKKAKILEYWHELDQRGIFMLNKILTGSFRVGISHLLTIDALSKTLGISKEMISLRLMGNWAPTAEFFESLKDCEDLSANTRLNPYPFYLASPVQEPLEDLGNPEDWLAEWKWDGIRAQCVHRGDNSAIWSRGNELISVQFPEIIEVLNRLENGTILDGEILAYRDQKPMPFSELQKRLGRKKVSKAMIQSVPIVFMIYDLLEYHHEDMRQHSFEQRRAIVEHWRDFDPRIQISPLVGFHTWDELRLKRKEADSNATEGLILKKKSSPYRVGRRRGHWWKFKIDPKTIDAVLIYAQPGQGVRANLYTDYTFGVWHQEELVPIVKAYSGLSQEEISQLDHWIRKNTIEKFGPVRRVKPEQVFEIAFEGIQQSSRHKSGVALRFPRIQRWRQDKPPSECDTLEGIKSGFNILRKSS